MKLEGYFKTAAYHRGLIFTIENRKYHYIRAVAWDFQHYGILTSVDSDEPLQPLFKLKTGLSPPVKYFNDRSKAVLLLWIFYVFVQSCVCYVLCASVYMCFLVTCWEGLTSWLSFVVSSVSLSLSHWYPGSGVVLDCTDS